MIRLTRLDGQEVTLNAELIEAVEATPNTTILLVTGNRYVVRETPQEVGERVVEYRRTIGARAGLPPGVSGTPFEKVNR